MNKLNEIVGEMDESFEGLILKNILKSIEAKANEVFEAHKQKMIQELDESKDAVIAGIILNISKRINLETYGTKVVIELKTEELK